MTLTESLTELKKKAAKAKLELILEAVRFGWTMRDCEFSLQYTITEAKKTLNQKKAR